MRLKEKSLEQKATKRTKDFIFELDPQFPSLTSLPSVPKNGM